MTDLEYLINILDNVEDPEGDHEPSYICQWPYIRDNLALADIVKEQDIRYLKNGKMFAEWLTEDDLDLGKYWYWYIADIVKGIYPLEKLPDHVRDIAKNLYYVSNA